jgi:mutator protein MutT
MSADPTAETPIAIAVVQQGEWVLIGRRRPGIPLAGMWEFPGGKVGPGEQPEEAAVRECLEETGLSVAIVRPYPVGKYQYAHGRLRLYFFRCHPVRTCGPAIALAADMLPAPRAPFLWVRRSELGHYEFPPANRLVLELLNHEEEGE